MCCQRWIEIVTVVAAPAPATCADLCCAKEQSTFVSQEKKKIRVYPCVLVSFQGYNSSFFSSIIISCFN